MGHVYIGTSGWQYSHWRGSFYPQNLPQNLWLSYYAKYFDTVEVNSSFYGQTKASTFQKWQHETSDHFVFAIKGNRFITHIKRLKNCQDSLKVFFDNLSGIVDSHAVLWQLPPSLKIDLRRLELFLKLLKRGHRYAIEFRHESWVDTKTWQILKKFNCAVVFQDWRQWPQIKEETANFIYIRFHGSKALYSSNYSDAELKRFAELIKKWITDKKDVYAYFNNDAAGFAVSNALTLKKLVL